MRVTQETITEEEYLVREPEAEYKNEFRDGEIVAMGGASLAHSRITANLIREIDGQLKGRGCTTFSSDTRIKVAAARFYTYPDVSVVCGTPQVDERDKAALLNPILIVEVLSPSSEAYDRGEKFTYYQKLDTLHEYVLVAQDRLCIERFSRQKNGRWKSVAVASREETLLLPAIDCRIFVRDVYDNVTLP